MKRLIFILMMISVAALSCTKKEPEKIIQQPRGEQLAKVDNTIITDTVVREEFGMLPAQVQEMFLKEGSMEDIVDELVKKELLYVEAKQKGLDRAQGFDKKVEDFKKRLMIESLLEEEIEKKASVTDKDVKDFYDKNKKEFVIETPGGGKGKLVEFERVKALIEQRLKAEKQKEVFDAYIDSLNKTHKVDVNREAIKKAFGNKTSP